MATIVDRRLNPRDKTIKNRQKFVQRSREQIKRAVKESIDNGKIADIEDGKARVRVRGVSEPEFATDANSGNKKYVMPGNRDYVVGDREDKPEDGSGQGGTKGGLGTSEDEFEFVLNPDEYLDFIFEDLELPDLVKKQIKDVTKVKPRRAGFTNVGNPSQLDVVRSLKNSLGRRIGLGRPTEEEIEELKKRIEEATGDERAQLELELAELERRKIVIPWLDPFDVRYRNFTPTPQPMTQAVMFCIMDVSGSMGQREKDLAKRFFFFLHMFLRRKYEKVDIVFLKHHEQAFEVDEDDFFHSRESGGTVVSTAIELAKKVIDERYNINDWNIYVAQVSDGDNYADDNTQVSEAMDMLLPLVQYYAYVEVVNQYYTNRTSDLWDVYENLTLSNDHMQMRKVSETADIWKVFKELFSKEHSR